MNSKKSILYYIEYKMNFGDLFTCVVCGHSFQIDDCVCVEFENGKPKSWKCCECIAKEVLKEYGMEEMENE
jgi:hypothetical protein